ncbi:MAG TPA: hypothetical protein PKX07_11970 [Aggregatilineales bacterium]|jgi:hypothetical protein|nr:hypothetical protein [Aggregatilineales bacterium]
MSSLTTFGAVMTFAIQLEESLQALYDGIGRVDDARKAARRKDKLERVRRENIVEITLEQIEGLNDADYALNGLNAAEAAAVVARFYADAAPKINVLQARRALERCRQELEAS